MDARGLPYERAAALSKFYSLSVTNEETHVYVTSDVIRNADFVMIWQLEAKVFGCCLIKKHVQRPDYWELYHLGVHKDKRDRGIATEMIQFAKFDLLSSPNLQQGSDNKKGLVVRIDDKLTHKHKLVDFFLKRDFIQDEECHEYVYTK